MPPGRKHLRRNRDAPTGGIGLKKNHFQFRFQLDRKSIRLDELNNPADCGRVLLAFPEVTA